MPPPIGTVRTANRLRKNFLNEVDQAIARIAQNPEMWGDYLHGTRRYLLRHFPYLIVCILYESRVHIVAVAHEDDVPVIGRPDSTPAEQVFRKTSARHLFLLPGRQLFHRELARRCLVFAYDHDVLRAGFFGGFERFFQPEAFVA